MEPPKKITDSTLFREAMQGVKPLTCDTVPLQLPQPPPIPKQRYLDEMQVRELMLSEEYDPMDLETGEELLFVRAGVQHSIFNKLRRGQLSVTAELDLHGMFVRVAQAELAEFLTSCCKNKVRCARIVHGKGHGSWQKQPVLKKKLNSWLRQRDEVLAFCSTPPYDGGTGAVYVLLKVKH
jgi:DNA-nicking Smr family endonuclease